MKEKIIIGHKNPDTDSVVSAMVFANYLNKKGVVAIAGVAGSINRETDFILSSFNESAPTVFDGTEEKDFFLVDHNELSQSVVKKENICGVLDHHALSGIKTDSIIYFRVEPVGSTATLIYKIMKEERVEIEKKDAELLLAGIISDTRNLNSPTTTEDDRVAISELSGITGVDVNSFAEKMFEAKSDFSGKSVSEIICEDMKEYEFGGKKIAIGVSETTSLSYFEKNEEIIVSGLKEVKKEKEVDYLFFGAVDIVNNNTRFYFTGEEEKEVIKKIFTGEEEKNYSLLRGVTSRKKEIAPVISNYFENNNK